MSRMVKLDAVISILNSALESYEDSAEYCQCDLDVARREGIVEDICSLTIDLERINACIMELRECIAEVRAL